jgi:hypothetical protein
MLARTDDDGSNKVVAVSSFRLEVPHLEDALQIFPVGYDITEAELVGKDDLRQRSCEPRWKTTGFKMRF